LLYNKASQNFGISDSNDLLVPTIESSIGWTLNDFFSVLFGDYWTQPIVALQMASFISGALNGMTETNGVVGLFLP
jgi:hypothetical protein